MLGTLLPSSPENPWDVRIKRGKRQQNLKLHPAALWRIRALEFRAQWANRQIKGSDSILFHPSGGYHGLAKVLAILFRLFLTGRRSHLLAGKCWYLQANMQVSPRIVWTSPLWLHVNQWSQLHVNSNHHLQNSEVVSLTSFHNFPVWLSHWQWYDHRSEANLCEILSLQILNSSMLIYGVMLPKRSGVKYSVEVGTLFGIISCRPDVEFVASKRLFCPLTPSTTV